MTPEQQQKIFTHAENDPQFIAHFLADPASACADLGVELSQADARRLRDAIAKLDPDTHKRPGSLEFVGPILSADPDGKKRPRAPNEVRPGFLKRLIEQL